MILQKDQLYKLLLPLIAMLPVTMVAVPAEADTTTVNQTIVPGLLTLTSPTSVSLPPVEANASADSTSEGSLGPIEVIDNRGTHAGWSVTATMGNFSQIKSPVTVRHNAPQVTTSGVYMGIVSGQYIATITTSGTLGNAKMQVSGLENDDEPTTMPTDGNLPIGSQGVMAHFPPGTYQQGDAYIIEVDQIPASDVTLIPANLTVVNGDTRGVQLGGPYPFSGIYDSATIITADDGNGFGAYSAAPTLRLTVPARSPIGSYTATLTETID